eukprot:gene10623-biopygen18317
MGLGPRPAGRGRRGEIGLRTVHRPPDQPPGPPLGPPLRRRPSLQIVGKLICARSVRVSVSSEENFGGWAGLVYSVGGRGTESSGCEPHGGRQERGASRAPELALESQRYLEAKFPGRIRAGGTFQVAFCGAQHATFPLFAGVTDRRSVPLDKWGGGSRRQFAPQNPEWQSCVFRGGGCLR